MKFPEDVDPRDIDGTGYLLIGIEGENENQKATENEFADYVIERSGLPDRVDTVESIAKLANQAKAYLTYQLFISFIKALAPNQLNVGQSFLIGTPNIPDIWVYSNESSYANYQYTSDQDLIDAISAGTTVQIGYYKIAFLESLNVDITNFYTKTQIDTLLAAKQAALSGTGFVKMAGTTVSYDNTTYTPVIALGSRADYQYTVILMFKDADITFHRIDGTLYSMFPSGVGQWRYNAAELAIHYARWNSSNNDKSFSVINKGSIFNFELVTCTYNSELWWGLKIASSQAMSFYFKGTTNGVSWNVVPYYNSNTATVLNAEINSSIVSQNSVLVIPKLGTKPFIIPDQTTGITSIPGAMTIGGNATVTGNVYATGEMTGAYTSDMRLKKNIRPIKSGLDIIMKLNPILFKWNSKAQSLNPKKKNEDNIGLSAQQVQEILPFMVKPIYEDYLSIDYVQLIPMLIKGMQEQQAEIDQLKKQLNEPGNK